MAVKTKKHTHDSLVVLQKSLSSNSRRQQHPCIRNENKVYARHTVQSLEIDVFVQCYALIVVHATIGLDTMHYIQLQCNTR